MKTIRTLLTLLVVSIFTAQNAWADRSAPDLPAAQTLVSETTYYLYNVLEGKFLCRSTTSTSYAAVGTYGDKVIITATGNEGEYTIKWANNNYYLRGNDAYVNSGSGTSNLNYFIIAESSKGYTIQRSSRNTQYYKADEFLGFNGSNGDRITPALAEGSIHWVLYSVEDAEYYMAKHKLYTYLEVADQYNFYVTQYDLVYNNPDATTAELDLAQATLGNALDMSSNYVSPDWTEYPVLFQNNTDNKWTLESNNSTLSWHVYKGSQAALETSSTLTGTVNVDNDATLCYSYNCQGFATLRVYLDGELVEIIKDNTSNNKRRYYIELTPGKHDIAWTCLYNNATTSIGYDYTYLSDIGVQNTPTITPATTTVEGQLGTEVLKLIDPVSSVKKIVINGIIGADDWTTIGLMVNAFSIDMSGATATAPMPASIFDGSKFAFLHNVKLPEGLTAIGERAFYQSDVENEMDFPASLTSVGQYAFRGSKLKAAYMKDGITSVGDYAFDDCNFLENATYPATATSVPRECFNNCYNLRTFTIPEGITTVSDYAFLNCSQFNPRFPSTMKTVENSAFRNTATDSLFVSENMTVYINAFSHCNNLVYAEWPTSFAYANGYVGSTTSTTGIVSYCPKLNKVKLMSPTVVAYDYQHFFYGNNLGDITLLVPDFLENAYKLDPYWYQCNVQGFNSADITDWKVTRPLDLTPGQRISGTPNLQFVDQARFTVNGDDVQTIGNMSINFSPIYVSYYVNQQYDCMLSNTNKVNITGELSENVLTDDGKWYFLTMPFDMRVGDIVAKNYATGEKTSYAIRYYDGASRAINGNSGNWKNYSADDIIPAGTGFIYQTAKEAKSKFVAQNNAAKQYILSNNEFVKALAANDSEVTANKGWNLVGNPWQTYYNIHKLNFTAPITVWNYQNNRYDAYSIIDDDYAIKPLEAIFVQCPDEINSISFPIDGRQLTDVIDSQNAVPRKRAAGMGRKLIDIELTNGEQSDKTRFVLNPNAKLDYETTCDASKFFSMESGVPQIYTIQNGVQMAINERPADNGVVKIGIMIPENGTYTIKSERNMLTDAVLVDLQSGKETPLATEDYTFNAEAGTIDSRFELHLVAGTTGIKNLNQNRQDSEAVYYNLNGQRVDAPQKGIYVVNGKKVIVK